MKIAFLTLYNQYYSSSNCPPPTPPQQTSNVYSSRHFEFSIFRHLVLILSALDPPPKPPRSSAVELCVQMPAASFCFIAPQLCSHSSKFADEQSRGRGQILKSQGLVEYNRSLQLNPRIKSSSVLPRKNEYFLHSPSWQIKEFIHIFKYFQYNPFKALKPGILANFTQNFVQNIKHNKTKSSSPPPPFQT